GRLSSRDRVDPGRNRRLSADRDNVGLRWRHALLLRGQGRGFAVPLSGFALDAIEDLQLHAAAAGVGKRGSKLGKQSGGLVVALVGPGAERMQAGQRDVAGAQSSVVAAVRTSLDRAT